MGELGLGWLGGIGAQSYIWFLETATRCLWIIALSLWLLLSLVSQLLLVIIVWVNRVIVLVVLIAIILELAGEHG